MAWAMGLSGHAARRRRGLAREPVRGLRLGAPHERGGERGGGPVLAKLDKGFDNDYHEVGLPGAGGLYMYVSWPRDVHCPSSDGAA